MSQILGVPFTETSKKALHDGQKLLMKFESFMEENLGDSRERRRTFEELISAAMWFSRAIKADQEIKADRADNPAKWAFICEKKKKAEEYMAKAVANGGKAAPRTGYKPARTEISYKQRDGVSRAVIVERKKPSV